MLTPGSRRADAIKACLILAGLITSPRCKTPLANRVTAPATTGDATLVPDKVRQPLFMFDPLTVEPYVTISGFTLPYPKNEFSYMKRNSLFLTECF